MRDGLASAWFSRGHPVVQALTPSGLGSEGVNAALAVSWIIQARTDLPIHRFVRNPAAATIDPDIQAIIIRPPTSADVTRAVEVRFDYSSGL